MDKTKFSIATITWARDKDEEDLLRQSLQKLAAFDIPVFICDGGSNAGFLEFLNNFTQFRLVDQQAKGLWNQVKASLAAAHRSGSDFILYTEPDKKDFFVHGLSHFLEHAQTDEHTGIALATRNATAFATFPAFQHTTETVINFCCSEITGKQADYTYGPFLLNRKLFPYLNLMQEETGWGWRPFTFGMASRLGYRVSTYEGDYACPVEQRDDNKKERIYRMKQLNESIHGLVLSTSVDTGQVK